MLDTPTPPTPGVIPPLKKACQISIMFPVADDDEAVHVKKRIDAVVGDIKEKRYTFNITEM